MNNYRKYTFLYREYVLRKKTASSIARDCGTTPGTIIKWLRRNDITIRNNNKKVKNEDYNSEWLVGCIRRHQERNAQLYERIKELEKIKKSYERTILYLKKLTNKT